VKNTPIQSFESYEAVSQQAAQIIVNAVREKPDLLLCAAAGSTPARAYELLAEQYRRDESIFDELRVIKLDEWGGIPMNDPGSCETQLRRQLILTLAISPDRYLGFKSDSTDPATECAQMRSHLELSGPIDLCVLGLGTNGHVGMNEPAEHLQSLSHVAALAEVSLGHTMLLRSRVSPTYGLTLGMAEILSSRQILLIVSGGHKREPFRKLLRREISTHFPASFLWLHPNWRLLCDQDAAGNSTLLG
jgi:galactosamine-6-phosphate isomerase